jgi:hypothetical protein
MRRGSLLLVLFLLVLLLLGAFLIVRVLNISGPGQPGQPAQPPPAAAPSTEQIPQTRTQAQPLPGCAALNVTCASQYFAAWRPPANGTCTPRTSNGYPVPDPKCTPGGINPSVSESTLTDPAWRTRCIRNCESSESQKHITYGWYSLASPPNNKGATQVCELDHLVPLEIGGADGLGNIWPQCGPDNAVLRDRYFKQKDKVENYLADEVRKDLMPLADAQRGIAEDWTQYLTAAEQYCASGGRC